MPFYFQLDELQKSFQVFQENYIRSKALLKGGSFDQKKQHYKTTSPYFRYSKIILIPRLSIIKAI